MSNKTDAAMHPLSGASSKTNTRTRHSRFCARRNRSSGDQMILGPTQGHTCLTTMRFQQTGCTTGLDPTNVTRREWWWGVSMATSMFFCVEVILKYGWNTPTLTHP